MKSLFLLILLTLTSSFATTLNVPGEYSSIQSGIDSSVNGDTVLVSPGTYIENIDFAGKHILVASLYIITGVENNISETIINGDQNGSVVIFVSNENSLSVLDGFTIANGNGTYDDGEYFGGGIYCNNSDPLLQNLFITGNTATKGAGVECRNISSPTLINVTLSNNVSSYRGGGLLCHEYSSPSLLNVKIVNNSAGESGGGIFCNNYSDPNLQNVLIADNTAYFRGGGIFSWNSSYPNLTNVTIVNNIAMNSGGGLYYQVFSSSELENSIVWGNVPQNIILYQSSVSLIYTDIQGNWDGDGNIEADPLFTAPFSGDYTLQPDSPCINAGNPNSPPDPDGTVADMGSFYFDLGPCAGLNIGDVNFDGSMNILDIVLIINNIVNETIPDPDDDFCGFWLLDYNSDGDINVLDLIAMVADIID